MLVLVQMVLVLLLLVRLESYGDRVDEFAHSSAHSSAQFDGNENVSSPGSQPSRETSIAGQTGFDDRQLRLIIREELATALGHIELAAQDATPAQEAPAYDEVEMQYRRELALEELEALKGQVDVSNGELERLMGDIARLNPEARVELIKMLNQALNRGEIKGHM